MIITLPNKISKYIWLNGELVNSHECNMHLLTHSLHYSGAVYEGERAYNGKIFKLKEHTTRLVASAKVMRLQVPYSFAEIIEAHKIFIKENDITDAYVRPLIFRGCESLNMYNDSLSVNLMIVATHSNIARNHTEFSLHISRWRKSPTDCLPPQVKSSGHYNMVIVAQSEAKALGYNDAIMLDSEGFVAEATTANIFFVKDEVLYTPIADTFLNGITRQTIIDLAKEHNIKTVEKRIKLEEIEDYSECFITGTAAEVKAVDSVDVAGEKITFDNSKVTELLINEYAKLVRS